MGFFRNLERTVRHAVRHPLHAIPAVLGVVVGGPVGGAAVLAAMSVSRTYKTSTVTHVGQGPIQSSLGALPPATISPLHCIAGPGVVINTSDIAAAVQAIIIRLPWLPDSAAQDLAIAMTTDMSVTVKKFFFEIEQSSACMKYAFLQGSREGCGPNEFRLSGGGVSASVVLPILQDAPGHTRGLTPAEVEQVHAHLIMAARAEASTNPSLAPLAT